MANSMWITESGLVKVRGGKRPFDIWEILKDMPEILKNENVYEYQNEKVGACIAEILNRLNEESMKHVGYYLTDEGARKLRETMASYGKLQEQFTE